MIENPYTQSVQTPRQQPGNNSYTDGKQEWSVELKGHLLIVRPCEFQSFGRPMVDSTSVFLRNIRHNYKINQKQQLLQVIDLKYTGNKWSGLRRASGTKRSFLGLNRDQAAVDEGRLVSQSCSSATYNQTIIQ